MTPFQYESIRTALWILIVIAGLQLLWAVMGDLMHFEYYQHVIQIITDMRSELHGIKIRL